MRNVELKRVIRQGWNHPDRVAGWSGSVLHREFSHPACRRAWLAALRKAVEGGSIRTALDVGTGPGTIAQLWAELGFATTGMDFSQRMLRCAQEAALEKGLSITLVEGDAESPPFARRSFDIVSSRFVLFTLPHPGLALRRWIDLLRPGGLLVCIGHDHPTVPGQHHKAAKRTWKMPERYRQAIGQLPFKDHTSGELTVVLEAAGLRDIRRMPMTRLIAARRALSTEQPEFTTLEHTPFILVGRK